MPPLLHLLELPCEPICVLRRAQVFCNWQEMPKSANLAWNLGTTIESPAETTLLEHQETKISTLGHVEGPR